ncbi:OLC1v1021439C1 [Oldenlandia corymbosa var. corymbosa]|uniref:OLC1v1021439C1 n=1 Tax=Oldenlandia corymbosa var. corymbosa TaxID=529605 RepID=A0AAV1BWA0_OLDCO|nr:OLC1v1021439C1 [Oldenlandia corymbosa var. corymbosa]
MTNRLSLILLVIAALFILNSFAAKDVPKGKDKPPTFEEAFLIYSVNLAIAKINETREYYLLKLGQNSSQPLPLKSALEECVDECKDAIRDLNLIPRDLSRDPNMTTYDALMAWDDLKSCGHSLKCHKVDDPSVLNLHFYSTAFVDLCVGIASAFF